MDMDQNKPVVLKFKRTAIDDLRDIYQECTDRRSEMINAARENYFLLGSDYRLMRADMLSYMDHYGNRIIPYGAFNNIPNPATINVTKIRHENEHALWIKENEEYFKTVMKRIREFEHVNQRYFTYDDFHFLDNTVHGDDV